MNAIDTATLYFDFSNKSDFDGIAKLFTDSTIYSSQNTGEYVGSANIIAMQRVFHGKFTTLEWKVNSIKEIEPETILFDYDFVGQSTNGEIIKSSGLEYVTVHEGKIRKIEIRNKN